MSLTDIFNDKNVLVNRIGLNQLFSNPSVNRAQVSKRFTKLSSAIKTKTKQNNNKKQSDTCSKQEVTASLAVTSKPLDLRVTVLLYIRTSLYGATCSSVMCFIQ